MNGYRSPEMRLTDAGAVIERYEPGSSVPTVPASTPLETVTAASLAGSPVPQRRFLDGGQLIPMRNVTMLSGDGGTGKSLLALQLGVAATSGTTWLRHTVEAGPVLYLSAEDDLAELHVRLAAICEADEIALGSLRELHLADLAGRDAVLAREANSGATMAPTTMFARLRTRIEAMRPRLVVIDNLADVFAGNENARPLARQFVSLLRAIAMGCNCAVLLLSHPSLSGMNSGAGTSGSTAWNNSVRSRLYLKRDRDDGNGETDPDRRVLETMKANHGPTGGRIELRWEEGRFVRTDMAAGTSNAAIDRGLMARQKFLELLAWHDRNGKPVSPNKSPSYAPAVFAAYFLGLGIKSREYGNAMDQLLHENRIRVVETGPRSKRRAKLTLVDSATAGNERG